MTMKIRTIADEAFIYLDLQTFTFQNKILVMTRKRANNKRKIKVASEEIVRTTYHQLIITGEACTRICTDIFKCQFFIYTCHCWVKIPRYVLTSIARIIFLNNNKLMGDDENWTITLVRVVIRHGASQRPPLRSFSSLYFISLTLCALLCWLQRCWIMIFIYYLKVRWGGDMKWCKVYNWRC